IRDFHVTGVQTCALPILAEFKAELDKLGDIKYLNIYINSPGGSVFVASTMVSMLERLKQKSAKINAYVDGIAASAASFLMMVAEIGRASCRERVKMWVVA